MMMSKDETKPVVQIQRPVITVETSYYGLYLLPVEQWTLSKFRLWFCFYFVLNCIMIMYTYTIQCCWRECLKLKANIMFYTTHCWIVLRLGFGMLVVVLIVSVVLWWENCAYLVLDVVICSNATCGLGMAECWLSYRSLSSHTIVGSLKALWLFNLSMCR